MRRLQLGLLFFVLPALTLTLLILTGCGGTSARGITRAIPQASHAPSLRCVPFTLLLMRMTTRRARRQTV